MANVASEKTCACHSAAGPEDTPYAFGFFVFDVFFPPGEPSDPIELHVPCMAHSVAAQTVSPAVPGSGQHDMVQDVDYSRLCHHYLAVACLKPCLYSLNHSVLVQITPVSLR